ncbi:hypothetical protein [Cohnella sp.]|uniref:hypothetical protein n=1 Tax=Cohnella sp. TaxID=1883426 RepID=UPI00356B02E5
MDGKQLGVDTLPSANFFRYEVHVIVEARNLAKAKNVIISMFPKNFKGNLLAAQRIVHKEFIVTSIQK